MRFTGFLLMALASQVMSASAVIDNAALKNEADGHNWAAYGRTYSETH